MKPHTLVLTCAGESSRFPGYAPKWALTHPSGNLMAAEAVRGITGHDRTVVLLRLDHAEKYPPARVRDAFLDAGLPAPVVHVVPNTASRVETVSYYLSNFHPGGSFTVKDCDNYFLLDVSQFSSGAWVAVAETAQHAANLLNRSYAQIDPNTWKITTLVERSLTPLPHFCCGAYGWTDPAQFLSSCAGTTAMTDVLRQGITCWGLPVVAQKVSGYLDWGTLEDWRAYTSEFRTLLIDIDGVLFQPGHRNFDPRWGDNQPIWENIAELQRLYEGGRVHLILATSRPEVTRSATVVQLHRAGVPYHQLVMGLPVCGRTLINDAVLERGEPAAARAINLPRSSPLLGQYLRSF